MEHDFCGDVRRISSVVSQPEGRNCNKVAVDISALLWALQTLHDIRISDALSIGAGDVLGGFNHPPAEPSAGGCA